MMGDENKPSENSVDNPKSSNEEELLSPTCFLSEAIEKQFLDENTSDMVLIVEKERFYVHKIILATRSEYFNALFYGNLKESKQTEIELHETAAEPFKLVLKYAYFSKIDLHNLIEETLMQTLELSRRYMIEDLEIRLCGYLKKIICVANICVIWDHAILFQMATLAKVCTKYAEKNAKEIVKDKSFLTLSAKTLIEIVSLDSFCVKEITIFRAIKKWIKQNKPENAGNILCHIRLPLIDLPYLFKEVRSSTLFSETALLSAIETQTQGDYEDMNYRKLQIVGENLASEAFGAKVIYGNAPEFLLNGNLAYDGKSGFTWHALKDRKGITVELKDPYRINSIGMLLWDVDDRFYSYHINVSVDGIKWFCVIDNRDKPCKSWQTLSFPPTIAKLIRIVGTHSSKETFLCVVSFECSFNDKLEE